MPTGCLHVTKDSISQNPPIFGSFPINKWRRPTLLRSLLDQVKYSPTTQWLPKRRLTGKTALDQIKACASVSQTGTMRNKITLPAKQTAAATILSAAEKKLLASTRARATTAAQKQILHNRTAASKGRHVIEWPLNKKGEMLENISCKVCKQSVARGRWSDWPNLPCPKAAKTAVDQGEFAAGKLHRRNAAIIKKVMALSNHKPEEGEVDTKERVQDQGIPKALDCTARFVDKV